MSRGELSSTYEALAKDASDSAGNLSNSVARLSEETAQREDVNVTNTLEKEAQVARSFTSIPSEDAPGAVRPVASAGTSSSHIGDVLDPTSDTSTRSPVPGGYSPSQAERSLQAKQVVHEVPLSPGEHANPAYKVTFEDGTDAVYKPVAGEDVTLRQGIPGGLANREVASYRVDEAFGFGRIPPTTFTEGSRGVGSLQQWRTGGEHLPPDQYPRIQQEQVAVLDYVIGNTDRHGGNYLTDPDGNFVAIDHGYSFPESPDPLFGIRSDFVKDNLDTPLSDDIMSKVHAVDPARLRGMLQATGIGPTAVDGAVARLGEIQARGMITGETWPGVINGRYVPMPTGPDFSE